MQTRAIVALIALVLAWFTALLGAPREITPWIVGYLVATIVVAAALGDKIAHKFWRAMPELFDVVLISVVISKTEVIENPWFLLYLFPVMSVARYLGRRGSFALALIATLAYGMVVAGQYSPLSGTIFGIRTLILISAALTAASLSRQRDEDASLLKAVEKIDREILNEARVPELIRSILQSAMEVTDSKISAIALSDNGKVSEIFSDAVADNDKAAARDLMRKHAHRVLTMTEQTTWLHLSQRPPSIALRVPQRRSVATPVVRLLRKHDPDYWTGRLVLLKVDDRAVGILGVFSRRLVHYTENDVTRLSSMAPLVDLARKHAKVFAESKQRLQLLYAIGENLAAERGLNALFKNVVRLVSDHLLSEEAALFTPDDRGDCIVKRAVWGPDSATRKKLEELETSYCLGHNSLTRRVFDGTELTHSNVITHDEVHAKEYRQVLPSRQTRDYLGAQLKLGSEILGVIRVLNKKADDYTSAHAALADRGFNEDDQNLLDMIATQVAAAIRSANFIEKQRYFQDIVYRSPDPIMVLDEHGRIRYFNTQAEKIWNRTENEARGESVINFYSSEAEARRVGKALEDAEDHTISDFMTEIRIGEEVVPVRLSASLLTEENGVLIGSIGLFKEQAERIRKAEAEQLAALTQMAKSFADHGHVIKNELGAIDNYLAGLKQKASGDPQLLEYYLAIRQLTTSIRARLRSMLSATRPEPQPKKHLLSLTAHLQEFAASVARQAADAEIAISLSFPGSDVVILADSARMHEVLVNLFANSVDAIKLARERGRPGAGDISVTTAVDSNTSKIRIDWQDDGIGMSAETMTKIFAAYYTTKSKGTGLGLFSSRRTLENHGGSIVVRSTAGVGTLFRITLPLPEAQEHTTEEATAS